jgi:hypothetical protein
MKTAIVTLFMLLCISTAAVAQDRVVIRDSQGRISATVKSDSSGKLVLRNHRGQITGSITIKGGNAQYRNQRGQTKKP